MTLLSSLKNNTASLLVVSLLASISFNSFAGYTKVSALISGKNDCGNNKYYDVPSSESDYSGFSKCRISVDGQYLPDAEVIAKFDTIKGKSIKKGSKYKESEQFKTSVKKGNWKFTNLKNNDENIDYKGKWTFNNTASTMPDIRFWAAKAGNGFRLFWLIEDTADVSDFSCTSGNNSKTINNLNLGCMNLAQSVTTGSWITPSNKGLSHITFFGGLCTVNCDDGPVTSVSEPSTFVIFALGLLGLGVRRKQSIKATK